MQIFTTDNLVWLFVAIGFSLLQTWFREDSKFPITVPTKWRGVVSFCLGLPYALILVFLRHKTWLSSALHATMAVLFGLISNPILWSGNEPLWAKILGGLINVVDVNLKSKKPEETKSEA